MAPQMKGLTQFIIDLRNSKDLQEENKRINLEINNIQTKFTTALNGYQKKKYICKLIYIYLLGYTDDIDFGLKESFDLISSNNYSEKHLGYLAISVLINNKTTTGASQHTTKSHLDDLLDLVHPYLIKDLQSNNEDFNCLAIQFIASNFNIYADNNQASTFNSPFLPKQFLIQESDENSSQWLEVIDIVYSLCCSPIQKPLLKKKASITLLILLKLYPQVIISNDNWVPRLLTLMDDKDLGVVLSSIPLIQFLTSMKVQYVKSIIPSVSNTLFSLIIDNKCPQGYFYYDTPSPWLIVKLLQLIEHFFLLTDNQESVLLVSDLDSNTLNNLRQVVARSIQNASHPIKGLPNRNSQSSILFQAVSLAVFLDASPEAIEGAVRALSTLLDSSETNTRYLALDALIKLTARASASVSSSNIKSANFTAYLSKVFQLLNDKDISVRKKALDLLYTICNSTNYNTIISRLLDYFPSSDLTIRSEIAVKIAILAEKFATESTWYVTTMLILLSMGGGSGGSVSSVNYIGHEVWERIVQIIINNEGLQKTSCKLIINLLKKPQWRSSQNSNQQQSFGVGISENLIKVAAIILGEYGYLLEPEKYTQDNDDNLLKDDEDYKPVDANSKSYLQIQFQLLYDAYFRVNLITRAMLLSTFFKWLVRFPDAEFIPDILDLYDVENQSLDLELQTRAHEYLKCANLILSNESASITNLLQTVLKPLPPFEKKESPLMNRLSSVQKLVGNRNRSSSVVNASKIKNNGSKPAIYSQDTNSRNNSASNLAPPLGSFNGVNDPRRVSSTSLGLSINEEDSEDSSDESDRSSDDDNPFGDATPTKVRVSPNWYPGYLRMLHYDAGIFYENQLIKITYRIIKNGPVIKVAFTIINNAAKTANTSISGFSVLEFKSMTSREDINYLINVIETPESTIIDKTTMEFEIKIRNIVETTESPILSLSFKCSGSFNQLHLKVPVSLLKTLSPTSMATLDEFKKRWLQIGELLGAPEGEHKVNTMTTHRYNSSNVVRLLSRLGFSVVHSTPDTFENGILVMGAGILHTVKSNYGVLTTVKSTDSVGKEFEIVVRCTGGGVAEVIALTLKEIFEGKF